MKRKLYVDDERIPKTEGWFIVRNYKDFVRWIEKNGLPDYVSFDHDFKFETDHPENEKNGYDCAKWMCYYCLDNNLPIPEWNVHSGNPSGVENITSILKQYQRKLNQ